MTPTLAITDLCVAYPQPAGAIAAVRDVSLTVNPAECVGIVGESGSGKTQLCLAVMGLLGGRAEIRGQVRFEGRDMLGAAAGELNRVRGARLAMVFQDPMTSLTPHLRIGIQLAEVLVAHARMSWRDAERAALGMLERVRIPDPRLRLRQYPHELSGGMRQRVLLGMSVLCGPALLIADEPTTALDVTVQAQIMELLRSLRAQSRTAVMLISHDLGLVAGLADRILVMYAGRVVESAATGELLARPAHPYTAELLNCAPNLLRPRQARMPSLPGQPPSPAEPERGCAFAPRCGRAADLCRTRRPPLGRDGGTARGDAARGDAAPGATERGTTAPGNAPHEVACHFPLPA